MDNDAEITSIWLKDWGNNCPVMVLFPDDGDIFLLTKDGCLELSDEEIEMLP